MLGSEHIFGLWKMAIRCQFTPPLSVGLPLALTNRDVTGFYAFSPPGNQANLSTFWGDSLTQLHSKPGEKGQKIHFIQKNAVETAPRNRRFLSLVVVERVLRQLGLSLVQFSLLFLSFSFVAEQITAMLPKRRNCTPTPFAPTPLEL